jgi:predicted RND superfamily exporter protein
MMKKFFRYPALIVIVIGVITVFFAAQLPRAELDNNNMRFVPDSDPALIVSRYIDDTFGSSLFVLVALERAYGTVFDAPFLHLIQEYVERVEENPVVSKVNSLVNADYIRSDGDAIVVEKLLAGEFSGRDDETEELRRRIRSWDMYARALVSDDFSATQILVTLTISAEDAGKQESIDSFIGIRDLAREMFADHAAVYVTGIPVLSATVNEAVSADLRLLVPLVLIVVLVVLFLSFRRLSAVLLPLLTVVIAAIWAIGAMPLFGVKLSIMSTVLPVILVAVGSAYGIHVVTHYASALQANALQSDGRALSREAHRELIFALLAKIGQPVFLAAITTFAGFVSFCFTRVLPIREFGFFASFGVLASFAVAVTLIPALLLLRGPPPEKKRNARMPDAAAKADPLSEAIAGAFTAIAQKKRFVLFLTAVVLLCSIYGLTKVIIDNVMVEYFRRDTDIYRSDQFIREQFGGSKVISVVAEADSAEIILRPDTLSAMDGLATILPARVAEIGKVMGFTDLIKRINQVFNADESPAGLRAAPAADSGGEDGDFGFSSGDEAGSDFGFGFSPGDEAAGGFGFGGFDDAPDRAGVSPGETDGERWNRAYTGEELFTLLERATGTENGMSANALVRNLERLVNRDGAAYYEIPSDPARYGKRTASDLQRLVSNYLVLLSGDINSYANDPLEPAAIKSTIQLRTVGQLDTDAAVEKIRAYCAARFPDDVRITIGGSALVEGSLNRLVVDAQLVSVLISLAVVFIIVAASNKSLIAGFIGVFPLSVSILINFAVMGFAGIKLNLGTAMVASVSVGIGIDYTIHYLEAYRRAFRASGGTGNFLHRTFAVAGKAIFINAASVGAGFAVLLLSHFNILANLGLLVALTMGTSALVSLTVIPVLLTVIKPKFAGASG